MFDDIPSVPMQSEVSTKQMIQQPQGASESQSLYDQLGVSEDQVESEPIEASQEASYEQEMPKVSPKNQENVRELRRAKQEAERRAVEAERRAEENARYIEMMRRDNEYKQMQQQAPVKQRQKLQINPDEIAEGKHLQAMQDEISELEQRLMRQQQENAQMMVETRIKSNYGDFDDVVTTQNLQELARQEPDLYASIDSNPDLYKKASSAYKLIKKLGIGDDSYETDKRKVAANMAKPKPSISQAARTQGPLAEVNAFMDREMSENEQNRLLREIAEATKFR